MFSPCIINLKWDKEASASLCLKPNLNPGVSEVLSDQRLLFRRLLNRDTSLRNLPLLSLNQQDGGENCCEIFAFFSCGGWECWLSIEPLNTIWVCYWQHIAGGSNVSELFAMWSVWVESADKNHTEQLPAATVCFKMRGLFMVRLLGRSALTLRWMSALFLKRCKYDFTTGDRRSHSEFFKLVT